MKTKCLIPIRYIVAASLMLPITAKADPVFPGTEWEAATPESQGLDPARLAAFQQRAGGAGAIVRNGYMIDAWGSQNTHGSDWGSVVKSFCSTLLFFELNEGRIPGPYEPVRPYVQQQFPGRDLMAKDVPITFFHLANYTSGYALPEAPGEAWSHNDYANKLYLFLVYGLLEVDPRNSTQLNAAITTPERMGSLQFQDGQIVALRAGTPRLTTSIRDTARIAWFWANKGRWGDQQLLPRSFFNTYAKAQSYGIPRSSSHKPHDYLQIGTMGAPDPNSIPVDPSFGFGWKFNLLPNGALMFPGCPPDFFYCQGVNRFVVVVPSLNLVALWRDAAPISNPQKPAVFAQLCGIINPQ